MQKIGPVLETLTRRLLDTPPDFLTEPRIGRKGTLHVAALVHDLLHRHAGRASIETLARFQSSNAAADRNRLSLVAISCWLLADDWFVGANLTQPALLQVLDTCAGELAQATPAPRYTSDPDRREELARAVLARLDYRPAGETLAQAVDRLSSVSGVERQRLLAASRAAEKRAREIRAALAKKAAEESADKWTRE